MDGVLAAASRPRLQCNGRSRRDRINARLTAGCRVGSHSWSGMPEVPRDSGPSLGPASLPRTRFARPNVSPRKNLRIDGASIRAVARRVRLHGRTSAAHDYVDTQVDRRSVRRRRARSGRRDRRCERADASGRCGCRRGRAVRLARPDDEGRGGGEAVLRRAVRLAVRERAARRSPLRSRALGVNSDRGHRRRQRDGGCRLAVAQLHVGLQRRQERGVGAGGARQGPRRAARPADRAGGGCHRSGGRAAWPCAAPAQCA